MEPLLTRFLRVYPERATTAGMGLRLELLGCQIEGEPRLHPETPCLPTADVETRDARGAIEMQTVISATAPKQPSNPDQE